jgi:hypothetical protein
LAKIPPQERYIQLTAMLFNSVAFRTLPPMALKLWFDLRVQFYGRNNGNISAVMSQLGARGWCSATTLTRAIWELLSRGLLKRTREGKPGPYRLCALYAFTDLATYANPKLGIKEGQPTREFASWVPGKSHAPKSKAAKVPKEKTPLQKMERYRSTKWSVTAPESGALPYSTAPDCGAVNANQNASKPAPVLARDASTH